MGYIAKLIVAVLVFLLAKWLLNLVGVPYPIDLLVAFLLAILAWGSDLTARLQ